MRVAARLNGRLLLLAMCGVATNLVAAPRILCCHDDAGKQICGDILPPVCYGRAYRELGEYGRTARVVEAPLSAEQRTRRAVEEKKKQEEERLQNEQRRKDQALLNTYGSEQDIEMMRARSERDLAAAIKASNERIAEIRARRKVFENEAEFYKQRKLPVEVEKGLRDTDNEIKAQESVIEAKKKDHEIVRQKYSDDLRRFIELSRRSSPRS